MGKLKGKNIPRKLKKEFKKVDCIEKTQPRFNYPQNPFQTSKFEFTTYQRIKLKDGVKVNRWTQRLVRNIYREIKREHKQALDRMIENQKAWARKGISPIDSFAEAMKRKSSVEFRREYLNEPIPEEERNKFVEEFQNKMKSGIPLSWGEEATVEFIPAKRPHRLHNHPKKERNGTLHRR